MRIERITAQNFAPFGRVIEIRRKGFPARGKNLWKIILRVPKAGWRIACLAVRDKSITRLEQHRGTWETFEPVRGHGYLFVADRRCGSAVKCFLLDKPVALKKGIWHGVVTLTREFDVKITENASVACAYWRLGFSLGRPRRRGRG